MGTPRKRSHDDEQAGLGIWLDDHDPRALTALGVDHESTCHDAGLEPNWPLHAVSVWLGHTKLETTAKYLNVTTQYLHELNERKPLTLVRA
jgi:hypothetical protein